MHTHLYQIEINFYKDFVFKKPDISSFNIVATYVHKYKQFLFLNVQHDPRLKHMCHLTLVKITRK